MKRFPIMTIVGGLVLCILYVPICVVVANAFNADESLNGWGGLTLEWFNRVFHDRRILRDFWTSVVIAVVATVIALVIAIATGLATRHMKRRARSWVELSTLVRIILPEVVIAVGLFMLMHSIGVPLGTVAVIIGHVVFLSAYATVIIEARFAALSTVFEEAAADLGASPWRTFWRVTMPSLLPAIIVAGLLSFTFSFDNVVTSLFLGGADTETLPVLILGLIRIRVSPVVNAIAVAVMVINLAALALVAASSSLRSVATVAGGGTDSVTPDEEPKERQAT